MKNKITLFLNQIKSWPLRKKITRLLILLVILFIIWNVIKPKRINPNLITIFPVESTNLISTVKASGSVTSVTDLNLSFKGSDLVSSVNVFVGQKVRKGQVLATLKNGSELGALTQARASVLSAKASLERTIEGSTTEEVRVAEVTLENAKRAYGNTVKLQDTLVRNALATLYSSSLAAVSTLGITSSNVPTISGTYIGQIEDEYTINVYPTGGGSYAAYTSTQGDSGSMSVSTSGPLPLGSKGLYVTFPTGMNNGETFKIKIPNTASSVYATNLNAYNSALETRSSTLETAQSSIDSAEANLALKKSAARPADVSLKEAEVLRAEGQLQAAQGAYENTVIRAPADGTITRVDVKVGELAKSLEPVIVLQDVGNLYIEANINESNITDVMVGQKVELTIDAYGKDKIFTGLVTEVEPGATITDGIVNYRVKVSLDENDVNVKPGMNANIVITTGSKENVIAIPMAAVENIEGQNFVKVITNEKKKTYIERLVNLGTKGSSNLVEITSGLDLGEKIALVEKE